MPKRSFWEKSSFVLRRTTLSGLVALLLVGGIASAQTFEVGQQSDSKASSKKKSKKNKKNQESQQNQPEPPDASVPQAELGWGSGLEVAQQLRAAQSALRSGDYTAATMHAERAAKAAPQNADLWFLLGYASRLAGHYQASVDAFKHGLAIRPSSAQGLGGLAQTYAKMGRIDEARQLLLQVIASSPNNPSDLQLAGELFLSSDPQKALELLTKSESIQAAPRTELLMSRAYRDLKQPEEAQKFLERARSRAPHDPGVLRAVAAYYRDTHHYDQAISTLREVSAKSPDYWAELGYTYQLAGQKNEAADAYLKAANGAKGEMGYQLGAADAMLNVGRLDTAADLLKHAETIDPNHYRLHALLGQLANQQDRTDDAVREYQAAISRLPAEGVQEGPLYPVQLHLNLAEVYRASDNQAAATEQMNLAAAQLKTIEAGGNTTPEFLRLRAAVESTSGDLAAAEKDLKAALAQDPNSLNLMLNYGNLLWKLQRQDESFKMFEHVLQLDPKNRSALTSLGFLSREADRPKDAEDYFTRAIKLFPNDHGPYLALGDVYTSQKAFARAQANYEKAHQLAPKDALVISRGANAALEDHHVDVAKAWLDRAQGKMNDNPQVMRERERYLTLTQQYRESAELGEKVVQLLPKDHEAPIYLGYDYVFLQRYDDALAVFNKYEATLPQDKDLWLIAGHSHRAKGDLAQAETDFTEALQRDPNMAPGFMNRGFVRNDLKKASTAAQDFEAAIKLRSDYGEAHLGLAMSDLQLHRAAKALKEVNVAEKLLGPSKVTHMTRAEAYRQRVMLLDAEKEYRAALKIDPNDSEVQMALASALFSLRRYQEAADLFRQVAAAQPNNAVVLAHLAAVYAKLHQPDEAMRYAQQAETVGRGQGDILLAIGEMYLSLGERTAAMQRFTAALEAKNGDGVETRLAIARLFLHEGRWEDAHEQVALGFAEARLGETTPITPQHLVEAAGIFLSMHEFELAKKYLERARAEGADPEVVALGMTNAYLAQGQTQSAEAQLAVLAGQDNYDGSYDFLMAQANLYRQRRRNVQALAAFARADEVSGDDKRAEQAQYQVAAEEGHQITEKVSVSSLVSFAPIFEDINVYTLDAKLSLATASTLPPPRSSFESRADAGYHLHFQGLPTINGFVEERNARGTLSFPSRSVIENRDTYDTTLNTGINPTVRFLGATIALNPGIQFTVRRDHTSPRDMNQNLFRQFLHMSTSSFFNWLSVSGSLMRETGPFTEQDLHSRDLAANISFRVGRPWGKTALITGYGGRDVLFRPLIREYYTTNTYVGVQRQFGESIRLTVLGDYIRSWKVVDSNWAIAQAMRPAVQLEYRPASRWSAEGSFTLSRGEGFHAYDNVQSGFLVSYVKPMRGTVRDGDESIQVAYPLRFSFGLQQQQFYNFSGGHSSDIRPVVRMTF